MHASEIPTTRELFLTGVAAQISRRMHQVLPHQTTYTAEIICGVRKTSLDRKKVIKYTSLGIPPFLHRPSVVSPVLPFIEVRANCTS